MVVGQGVNSRAHSGRDLNGIAENTTLALSMDSDLFKFPGSVTPGGNIDPVQTPGARR